MEKKVDPGVDGLGPALSFQDVLIPGSYDLTNPARNSYDDQAHISHMDQKRALPHVSTIITVKLSYMYMSPAAAAAACCRRLLLFLR